MTARGTDQRRRLQDLLSDLWRQVATPGPSDHLLTTTLELVTPEGPLRLGRDREGLPHLLVPLSAGAAPTPFGGGAGLSLGTRDLLVGELPVRFLDVACLRSDLAHVFAGLAVDICLRLVVRPENPVAAVTSVIDEWRSLLERRSGTWTRSRAVGLLAELIVLRRLVRLDVDALGCWTGPFGAAQDFRSPGRAIEVKATVGAQGRVVRVHGSDQLEEPAGGELHLAWFRLGESFHGGGVTVRAVMDEIAGVVTDSRAWTTCLAQLGVPVEPHPELDDRRFVVLEERWYRVGPSFPRIVPASFGRGAVPAGVGGIDYLLDLDVVPVADVVDHSDDVLARMAGPR